MPTRFQSVGASRPPRTKSPMCTEAARVEALRHRPLFHTSSSCTTYTEQRYRFMLSPCNSCRRHSWALLGFHLFGWDSDALNCSRKESKTAATVPQRIQSTERMQPRREAMPVVDWIAAEKDFAIGNSAQMLGVDILETWDHGIATLETADWSDEAALDSNLRLLEYLELRVPEVTIHSDLLTNKSEQGEMQKMFRSTRSTRPQKCHAASAVQIEETAEQQEERLARVLRVWKSWSK
ncbi:hypothetical protein BKA62DRAFT_52148 [Auriculariales sp. MPI-PUGE-AT-0066]|nr:hypothetical protein BKA62DRAFT_52148 [Auriculariales sp. MPI-PUGE-AT-0066]